MSSQKNLHMDVYSSFIHNCQNLEATKISFGRWMDKLWCIQTVEYYSVLKRNELLSHAKKWGKLKFILLNERDKSEKTTYHMIPTIWHSGKGKTVETIKRSVGASLVAQWLRICLPMQGTTRVRALVWEDPTCHGATRPMSHNYWACASGACALQQERPR